MGRLLQLIAKDEDVHREKSLHPPGMKPGHDLGQLNKLKVLCPKTSIESLNPEINGISTVGNRRPQGLPIPSWGEQLWER